MPLDMKAIRARRAAREAAARQDESERIASLALALAVKTASAPKPATFSPMPLLLEDAADPQDLGPLERSVESLRTEAAVGPRALETANTAHARAARAINFGQQAKQLAEDATVKVGDLDRLVGGAVQRVGAAETQAQEARRTATDALAQVRKTPGMLELFGNGFKQALDAVRDLASAALKQIADLGVVVKTLEQKGYTLVAHYSNGESKVVARMGAANYQIFSGGNLVGAGGSLNLVDPGALKITTADYAMSDDDFILLCDNIVPINVTLPSAVGRRGRRYVIKRINIGLVTVLPTGTLLERLATVPLPRIDDCINPLSDNRNWLNVP